MAKKALKARLTKHHISNFKFAATTLLIVELIHTHVLLLDLDGSVVERVDTMLARCYRNHHFGRDDLPVDAPGALRRNSKNFAHNASEFNVKQK